MFLIINNDCSTEEFFRYMGIALAASKLYKDYMADVSEFQGIGPESFAEWWIGDNIMDSDEDYDNAIMSTFVSLLGAT